MTIPTPSPPGMHPRTVDVRRLIVCAVAWPLLLMGVVAGLLGVEVHRHAVASAALDRGARTIAAAHLAEKNILDEETGLRGFLVTEESAFLRPYQEARPLDAIDELDRLAAGTSVEPTVTALRSRYREWHQHAEEALGNPAGAKNTAAMLSRKAEMDLIRALVAGIIDDASEARRERAQAIDMETSATGVGAALMLVGVGVSLSVASRKKLRQVADGYEEAIGRHETSEDALATLVQREHEARERAENALRARDEFLSTLSHELRTPLTAILGWSGVLKTRALPPERASRAILAIERNAKVQAQIVEDILDASRLVSGRFKLRVTVTDVGAVVRSALDVVRFSAESKEIAIETALPAEPVSIVADADRLHQIVWNLLSNAIKFTPRHGHVRVSARSADAHVVVEVRDDGEGIDADFLPHAFERFRQADSSWKRRHGGLGLGLALVKHLVDLHGGDVRAESDGPGRGAVFTVTLPVRSALGAGQPEGAADASDAGSEAEVEPDALPAGLVPGVVVG